MPSGDRVPRARGIAARGDAAIPRRSPDARLAWLRGARARAPTWSTRRGVMQTPQRISIARPWNSSMARRPRSRAVLRGAVVVALVVGLTGAALLATVADAAPGGLVADVVVAEWPNAVSP